MIWGGLSATEDFDITLQLRRQPPLLPGTLLLDPAESVAWGKGKGKVD